jgi:hypothetical protein
MAGCDVVSGLNALNEVPCDDVCVDEGVEGGGGDQTAPGADSAVDSPADGARLDAAGETGAAPDAEPEVTPDAGPDGDLDAPLDGPADVGPDVPSEDVPDTAPDTAPDTSTDGAFGDGGSDASDSDAGPIADAGPFLDSSGCTTDLSFVGTADFRVALRAKTTQTGLVALVNQRSNCGPATFWWDLRIENGYLLVETESTGFSSSGNMVNDGTPHDILLQRTGGRVYIFVDGIEHGSGADTTNVGQLGPLEIGTDPCVGSDGTQAFSGQISNLCLSSP